MNGNTPTPLAAFDRGYTPIPILDKSKRPAQPGWTHTHWETRDQVEVSFARFAAEGASGVGLLLGKPSGGLIDVDLDHPIAQRLAPMFLPKTPMRSGRAGRPNSHYWYRVIGDLPTTRAHRIPRPADDPSDEKMISVELRSTGGQTVIPPSVHPSGQAYHWEGEPWGGDGPSTVDGLVLARQVAGLALASVLVDGWPRRGSRHESYLALAGGLLRYGDGVHPYWEKALPDFIRVIALETHDDDGPDARVKEVMGTTLTRLREGRQTTGFPRLAEFIGPDHAELARRLAEEVENNTSRDADWRRQVDAKGRAERSASERVTSTTLPPEDRNPMDERVSTWEALDLEPYLSGRIVVKPPTILRREDGQGLMYPGRVNSVYGKSESAKSWIALFAAAQEMAMGARVLYLDFEDDPTTTIERLKALGVGVDDIARQFRYVHPEGPLSEMQRYAYGDKSTDDGKANSAVFITLQASFAPDLIIADGMTSLYGLHGHNTNDATGTDVITTWLKQLCDSGRRTVLVIDHTGKGEGGSPIGAHHKIAMVQGTALEVNVKNRPMPGAVGKVQLLVRKDRPGIVRKASVSVKGKSGEEVQIAAVVVLDSLKEGITTVTINPPDPPKGKDELGVDLSGDDADVTLTKADKLGQMGEKAVSEQRRLEANAVLDARVIAALQGTEKGWCAGKPELLALLGDPAPTEFELRDSLKRLSSPMCQAIRLAGSTKNRRIELIPPPSI